MNVLAHLDSGDAVTGLLFTVLLQTSVVILLAALLSRVVFGRRAEARHVLWLATLALILISPAVAVLAGRSGFALWAIALPDAGYAVRPALGDQRPRREVSRSDPTRFIAELHHGSVAAETVPPRQAMEVTRVEPAQFTTSRAVTPELNQRGRALRGGLTLLWMIGALLGLARIAAGWRRLTALSGPERILDSVRHGPALERVRDALGLAALPPVVTSATIRAPVAVGLLCPRVILPEGLAESLSRDSLRDVLVHEYAHVVRLDAWVVLLQRLTGVVFWPHPLVHYASGQLSRAREEVCDNHVLQCGDARGYARTLLALTEQCLPIGAMRPGLGILGARWTLADRVAGLLDTRRIPMTCTTFRMKIAVWVTLGITGLGAASVRLDRPARAGGPQDKPAEPRAAAAPSVWTVEGIVVDERGQPVAGAAVRGMGREVAVDEPKSGPDGGFILRLGGRRLYIWGVVAETDGGARIGLVRFEDGRTFTEKDPVRIVLKPSRPLTVRVSDAAGLPVAGAAVDAIEASFRASATTGPQGTATLRVAADAKIEWVFGLKAGAGFDYFENYTTFPAADYPPLPAAVSLMLEGADTARVKVVDSTGQPVSGVEIGLGLLSKIGKVSYANVGQSAAATATADREGFATFDWLPKSTKGTFHFQVATNENYSSKDAPSYYQPGGQAKLTTHVLRDTRLSGTVRFPDGRPAAGLMIMAGGEIRDGRRIRVAARTVADGAYLLDAPSESSYIIAVADETWAAPSLANVIVREGQAQGGLDLTLTKGTLLHGLVTEPPDHRPVAGAVVYLSEQGGPLPKELRGSDLRTVLLDRTSNADTSGRYHFRIGPGRYTLRSRNAGGTERLAVEVKNEAEIVRDLALKGPARETYLIGVVIEKTPTGDRPVPGARVSGLRAGFPGRYSIADDRGRFRLLRVPGDWYLYGASHERSLGGLMPVTATADNVRLVVSKAPTITGRVIDSDGMPQAARDLAVRIDTGPDIVRAGRLDRRPKTDEQGRYAVSAAPVGSYVEVSVGHEAVFRLTAPRTVVRFEVFDADPIVIPDLVVPVEKTTK